MEGKFKDVQRELPVDQLIPFFARDDTKLRQAVSTEKRIAITLWHLATNSDYRTVEHLFGVQGVQCV